MIRTTNGYGEIAMVQEVELIDWMGDDNAVCDAARVSFSKQASEYTSHQNERLLNYLAKHDHWSPFAHCFMKFRSGLLFSWPDSFRSITSGLLGTRSLDDTLTSRLRSSSPIPIASGLLT